MNKSKRLTKEERDLLKSVEHGEWKSVPLARSERQRFIAMARRTLRKNRRINIRLSEPDLEALQARAFQEGIPYQTLVTSVLHKYVTGQIKAA